MIDFNAIRFPVEGTVNRIVHFSDTFHQYAFSFVSPFVYHQPEEYQKKGAFLVAKYNPFNPDIDAPEEIYGFFIPEDESRKVLLDKKRNLTARRVHLYSADEEPLGAVEVLYPNHRLFRFVTTYPNRIFDAAGNRIGVAHFQPARHRKCVYSCAKDFDWERSYSFDEMVDAEKAGKVELRFSYGLQQKEMDLRSRLEAMFSPSKKSESILNQIDMPVASTDDRENLRYLLAMIAFFWTTVIDLPIFDS